MHHHPFHRGSDAGGRKGLGAFHLYQASLGVSRQEYILEPDSFFWMISLSTLAAILLSFTRARNYEGAGASRIGSVFIYILVASIGMKMDLTLILDNVGLVAVGIVGLVLFALLTRRLQQVARSVRDFEQGKYDTRLAVTARDEIGELVPTRRRDEIGVLTNEFYSMAARIKSAEAMKAAVALSSR